MTPHAVKACRREKRCPREGNLPIVQRGGELQTDHTAIITRLVRVLNERNYDLWETLVTELYLEDKPRAVKVSRGATNLRTRFKNYHRGIAKNIIDMSSRVIRTTKTKGSKTRRFTY